MKTRIIASLVGIAIAVVVMVFGEMNPLVMAIAVSLLNALLCGEYLSAKNIHKNLLIFIVCLIFAVSMPLVSLTAFWYIPIYIFSLILFSFLVFFHDKIHLDEVIFSYAGTMLLTLSMSLFARLTCEGKYLSFWCVLTLAVPWMADSTAYFAGRYFGKRKLCPAISPKKTVEGAFGSVLGGIVGSMLLGLIFLLIYRGVSINFLSLLLIGLINSMVSIIGDLVFSVVKRHCNIKDYGTIMPGHGGMLDRFDSVIFCIPVVYILSRFFVIIA